MRIRLGYVAIALNLPKVTSSSTLTYSRYSKISTDAERLNKLKEVTRSNIYDLEKILNYNVENQIHFYRLTSNLIPLGTHPDVSFNYRKYFKKDFEYIGNLIKKSNMRVDSHPDQFNVINSIKDSVVENTIKSLKFQSQIFEDINYEEGKMIIHIGSSQGGKEESKKRFIDNLKYFPSKVLNKLILENDDKVFTAQDVLDICKETKLPMVLDVHHHICKNNEEEIKYMLKDIFDTWNEEVLPPKIHFSSPREFEKDRKHADFINSKEFLNFVYLAKQELNRDFDVMIEAKKKDLALKQLVDDIKNLDEKIKFIDETTIEI
ncbi:UV DNA damage repair endonuclease UvsE [Paraclostridium ghonii]|uniref:UV DNA damage endonuclease n=1 Tax=Paraclostridium ghonii TaxID=29358 RepID=A0ABU0MXA8_9FIRM|nr:UV DNA damage repair endonuclease UvsE [Paeniclostridium ghonii]MDQ0555541.1 UV DNA damage endonuclease [Paeniclostridium ghonii]